MNPDPEEAYEKAIKAVEEAEAQVVEPNNKKATLASTLGEMRNSGKWTVEIVDKTGDHYTDLVYDMIDALWNGQPSPTWRERLPEANAGRGGGGGHVGGSSGAVVPLRRG